MGLNDRAPASDNPQPADRLWRPTAKQLPCMRSGNVADDVLWHADAVRVMSRVIEVQQ